WSDYSQLYFAAQSHAKLLWGSSLKTGVTSSMAGLLTEPGASLMSALNQTTDIVSVTYFPHNADFTAVDPAQVPFDLFALVQQTYPKPIFFQGVGYPSSPATKSSVTLQSAFFYAFFDAWDRFAQVIPYAGFSRLYDFSPTRALSEATAPHLSVAAQYVPTA